MKLRYGPHGRGWTAFYDRKRLQPQILQLLNESIDLFYQKNPIWDLMKDRHSHRVPFYSDTAMKIPLQYTDKYEGA